MLRANREEIIQMHKEGKTAKEIAAKYGVTNSFVSKKLREWGFKKEKLEIDMEKAILLYRKTNNSREVAREMGLPAKSVYRALIKAGEIESKKINVQPSFIESTRGDEIIDRYKNGESVDKIAEIIGCSNTTISNILKKNKVLNTKSYDVLSQYKDEIIKLYHEDGLSQTEIAKRFKVSTSSISLFLRVNKS